MDGQQYEYIYFYDFTKLYAMNVFKNVFPLLLF